MTSLTFHQRWDGRGRRRIGDGVFWVHQSKRCRGMRGSIAALCLVSALCLIRAAWSDSGALSDSLEADPPEVALARVVEIVEPDVVILSAGRLDGLTDSARVLLLREGDPIVHPLTGKVLCTSSSAPAISDSNNSQLFMSEETCIEYVLPAAAEKISAI